MIPTEARKLSDWIQTLFPQQPITDHLEEALIQLLHPYAYADAKAAVLSIAQRGEHWCAPTDVLAEVKRVRSTRINARGDLTPPSGLTVAQEIEWLREARRTIGDGGTVDDTRKGLKARPMRALLGAVFRAP